MMVAQRIASVMGFKLPAAKGATVRGTRAAEISLFRNQTLFGLGEGDGLPLECPMVTAMNRLRMRYWRRVIC